MLDTSFKTLRWRNIFCRFSEKKKSLLVDEPALAEWDSKNGGRCFFSFLCLFIFSGVLPKKGVIVPGRAFHKLLGNFLATSGISSNVLLSEQFLSFSSNSEISEKPLVLKFVFLKKEPDPPPWGRSWAKHACSRAARSAVFKRKFKMADAVCLRWRRSFNNFIGSY